MTFEWKVYKALNPDLENSGIKERNDFVNHYLKYGKNEKRMYSIYDYCPSFNINIYKYLYSDLCNLDDIDLMVHWIKWGEKEGRVSSISQIAPDFNHEIYKAIYSDLINMSNEELEIHWIQYGRNEGRTYKIGNIYPDFNHEIYKSNYPDLYNIRNSNNELELHWLKYGRFEGRIYDKMLNKVSIVMAYHNRKEQTIYTLDGFERMYFRKYKFEVVLVDDNSTQDNRLDNIISKYSYPIKYIYITKEEKGERVNPCSAYNKGFENISADTEVVIIQNPECFHYTDLIDKMGYLDFDKIYYTTLVQ